MKKDLCKSLLCLSVLLGMLSVCAVPGFSQPTPPEPAPYPGQNDDSGSEESAGAACTSLPDLRNFTISSSTYSPTEITLTLTPDGNPGFEFVVMVSFASGNSVLSAYCTGSESLCKAVGNGSACSGTNYSGSNAWCYKAESSSGGNSSDGEQSGEEQSGGGMPPLGDTDCDSWTDQCL